MLNSNKSLTIERINIDQSTELLDFAKQTFIDTYAAVNTVSDMDIYLSENFSLEQVKKELNTHGSEFYSAKLDEQWVGYLKINKNNAQTETLDGSSIEIERIYVLDQFHGKGIAQKLYNKALSLAEQNASDYLWLGVWNENPRAIQFYKKCGFEVFDTHEFKLGSCLQKDLLMRLMLKTSSK